MQQYVRPLLFAVLPVVCAGCGGVVTLDEEATAQSPSGRACGVYRYPGLLLKTHWPEDGDVPVGRGVGLIWEQALIGSWRVETNLLLGEYEGAVELVAGAGVYVFDIGTGLVFGEWDCGRVDVPTAALAYVGFVIPIPGVSTIGIRHTWCGDEATIDGQSAGMSGWSANASVHLMF